MNPVLFAIYTLSKKQTEALNQMNFSTFVVLLKQII